MEFFSSLMLVMTVMMAGYFLRARALCELCERRNFPRPWTAWLPEFGRLKVGTVAYRGLSEDRVLYRIFVVLGILRGILLIFIVPFLAVTLLLFIQEDKTFISSLMPGMTYPNLGLVAAFAWAGRTMLLGGPYWVLLGIARYRIYRFCDPANATNYLITGIFLPFLNPLFLFLACRKDEEVTSSNLPFL